MLTNDQKYILSLLQRSMSKEDKEFINKEDKEYIIENPQYIEDVILRNGILLTVYKYLPSMLQSDLSLRYIKAIKQSMIQTYEGKQIIKSFNKTGLNCIFLKGWELRKLYPQPTMRQMADLDILVKPFDFKTIQLRMNELGYSSGTESTWKHDYFKKREVTVEMHKRLTDDSGIIQTWEKEMWQRAEHTEGNVYRMLPEDFYLFHFIHLHKHFLNGSLGLRRIVDTWLLQDQPTDMKYVRKELDKFGISIFHDRMISLSRATMGDEIIDEDAEILLTHAFNFGIYGNGKSYKAGRIAMMGKSLRSGKIRSALAAVFLPYKRMKAQFPILKKWPILLPFCWAKRIISFMRGDIHKYKSMMDYHGISEADYTEMKAFLKAGGILKL